MKRHFVLILVAILVLAGLTATAQIQRGKKKQETKPKTEQTTKNQTPPKTNQGQTKKQGTKQQAKGNSGMTQAQKDRIIRQAIDDMVYVEGGTFTMGATAEQGSDADKEEKPSHKVTLSSYYISKYEVTQQLWQAVMGSNPSWYKGDKRRPVEQVSWEDCQEFIRKLNELTGRGFRLPTEAEWEYAARGGKKSRGYKYSGSDKLSDVAWIEDNSGGTTHPVGQKSPNELGLYDMSGNVMEWCQDWWGDYSSGSQSNPTGPKSGSGRVVRGGSRGQFDCWCRVSSRSYLDPSRNVDVFGFRLALSL